MREKIIQLIVILVVLLIGVLGTLYFVNNQNSVQTESSHKNVTVKEENSIASSIDKVYDAVYVIEAFSNGTQSSSGSGFVYKKDSKYGYILTNYHVVDGASSLKVVNMNGDEVSAKYLGGDSYADIAVLRIDAKDVLDVASLGDSTKSKVGDTVFTVGTPVDSEYIGTVTKGILSGANRTITVSDSTKGSYMMEVLQTDASINPGNSGGPLVNMNGEVIGITSMKLVTSEIEGMGFAIPIEIATSQIEKLEKGEEIKRPYIGVSLYDVSNTSMLYRNNLRLSDDIKSGAVVAMVEDGSPAASAGLKTNDVILKVDGNKIKSTAHFKFMLYKHSVGDTVKLTINRDGKETELSLKLSESLGND